VDAWWRRWVSSPDLLGAHASLWVAVDEQGMSKCPSRWDDASSSTIHSTYYNYYQNYVL
jgi:hypothetical protein